MERKECVPVRTQYRYAIVPFPFEQPICSFQKLERRWNGKTVFPSEHNIGTQSFRSRLNSLYVRSRNWNEDGTERSCELGLRLYPSLHIDRKAFNNWE